MSRPPSTTAKRLAQEAGHRLATVDTDQPPRAGDFGLSTLPQASRSAAMSATGSGLQKREEIQENAGLSIFSYDWDDLNIRDQAAQEGGACRPLLVAHCRGRNWPGQLTEGSRQGPPQGLYEPKDLPLLDKSRCVGWGKDRGEQGWPLHLFGSTMKINSPRTRTSALSSPA